MCLTGASSQAAHEILGALAPGRVPHRDTGDCSGKLWGYKHQGPCTDTQALRRDLNAIQPCGWGG